MAHNDHTYTDRLLQLLSVLMVHGCCWPVFHPRWAALSVPSVVTYQPS